MLPAAIDDPLSGDGALHGAVLATIATFEPWVEDNKLPFFPGYTDHGPDHIRSVIMTAGALITNASWKIVTEADLALVVLGSLLHDCAMHLSEDGFRFLLTEEALATSGFDDPPWRVAWQTFLSEAMRWDGRKLYAVFGDASRVQPPSLDTMEMRMRDRLLIGEFVRRHHPRMAQEIALRGVPGVDGRVPLADALDDDLRRLAGLVARSHGMPIRAAVDRLPREQQREVRGAHVPYAMALLRIADYIQIDDQRAPADLPRIRRLRSPISRGEWSAHAAIKDLTLTHDDPEALLIRAEPESAGTFLKLRDLFQAIQAELDESWAALGETYGRIAELSALGLRIRRLRSNLDDMVDLAKRVPFVPVAARFDTAGADLLKLLIEPLYGENPQIGIRELLQNAVDAVLERRDLLGEEADDEPAVTIDVHQSGDEATLDIVDRGVGMRIDTIVNYFLKAGASFRNSEQWKTAHGDGEGRSRVFRSGRFGVGVLAAFLMGDRLEVSTRHVDDEVGIEFTASIDDETIELRKVQRQPGTSIRVHVRKEAIKQLRNELGWDWFCLREPRVVRRLDGKELRQQEVFPSPGGELPPEWRRIFPADYREVHWTFNRTWAGYRRLVCNGIQVIGLASSRSSLYAQLYDGRGQRLSIVMPTLSVFDPDGNLPLNLQRTALRTPLLPFAEELIDSIATDLVAFVYARASVEPSAAFSAREPFAYPGLSVSGAYHQQEIWNWFWCTPNGWSLVDQDMLNAIDPKQMIVLYGKRVFGLEAIDFKSQSVMPTSHFSGSRDARSWARFVMGRSKPAVGPLASLQIRGSVVVFRKEWFTQLGYELAQGTFRHSKVVHENGWSIVYNRDTSGTTLDVERIVADQPQDHDSAIAELLIEKIEAARVEHPVTRIWRRLVPGLTIPFDPTTRARLRPPELEPLIAAYRSIDE